METVDVRPISESQMPLRLVSRAVISFDNSLVCFKHCLLLVIFGRKRQCLAYGILFSSKLSKVRVGKY